jgi:hypothetical protein
MVEWYKDRDKSAEEDEFAVVRRPPGTSMKTPVFNNQEFAALFSGYSSLLPSVSAKYFPGARVLIF